MKQDFEYKLNDFNEYIKKIKYLNSITKLLTWDMRVNLPIKGISYSAEALGYLASKLYELNTSSVMKEFIEYFMSFENLDDVTKSMVKNAKKNYDYFTKVPEKRYKEYAAATLKAEAKWQEAKKKSDFSLFSSQLKEQFEFKKEFAEYWGYKGNKYNALLDIYEPGMTAEKLDMLFNELKIAIIKLLNMIKSSKVIIDNDLFKQYCPADKQKSLLNYILSKVGFDFEAGWVGESIHPVTTIINRQNVRITNHYYENEFQRAAASCLHEGGHAIYAQNIPENLEGTMLDTFASHGINESQSKFYENIVGKSKEFWTYFLPEVKNQFLQFKDISINEFYRGINAVKQSANRLGSDELTFNLHIILRYELERAIINEEVEVEELPVLWNKKCKEYFGVEPENDADGVLQDMHWGSGLIGYFPCYALGNLYDGQFLNKIKKEIPDIFEKIQKGEFNILLAWLKDNIYKYGSIYEPEELIKKITGEELTAKYYIDYLNDKYTKIYELI